MGNVLARQICPVGSSKTSNDSKQEFFSFPLTFYLNWSKLVQCSIFDVGHRSLKPAEVYSSGKGDFVVQTIQTEVGNGIGILSLKRNAPGALEKCKQALRPSCP